MTKRRLLIIGTNKALRRRIIALLSELSGVSAIERDSTEDIKGFFDSHRTDVVLVEARPDILSVITAIRSEKPGLPIIAYGDEPNFEATRESLLAGARDIIKLRGASVDDICDVLERSLDLAHRESIDEAQQMVQCLDIAAHRGSYIESCLVAGNPPPFYINGNRAVFLRANVVTTGTDDVLWYQKAAWEWIQEFGVNNCFIFTAANSELRLGAIVEQSYINQASFQYMLNGKLESCFARLAGIKCVCAASYCSSDYLSLAASHRLDQLTSLVFYFDESRLIPESLTRRNDVFPEDAFASFRSAVAVANLPAAIDCIDQAVERLRQSMPSPDIARARLTRFLMDFICIACSGSRLPTSLGLNETRLTALRESVVRIIQSTMEISEAAMSSSPLEELIQRIEANPGLQINIDQAAAEANYSRSHFCRLFRQQVGVSFTEFLTKKRIGLACNLLSKTGIGMEEVAEIVGIGNTWYFKKLFLKETGKNVEDWISENHIAEQEAET